MAFQSGRSGGIGIMDSSTTYRNVSSYFKSLEYSREADTNEVTTFNSSEMSKDYVAGNQDATLSGEGVWDLTIDGYLDGILGKKKYIRYFPATTAAAETNFINYKQYGILTSYSPPVSVDDANTFSCEWQMTGPRQRLATTA